MNSHFKHMCRNSVGEKGWRNAVQRSLAVKFFGCKLQEGLEDLIWAISFANISAVEIYSMNQ